MLFSVLLALLATSTLASHYQLRDGPLRQMSILKRAEDDAAHNKAQALREAMLTVPRVTWEQGSAQDALLEYDYPQLSLFGSSPFKSNGNVPYSVLRAALASVVKGCEEDGRLSSFCWDSSQLDGIASGMGVILGEGTEPAPQTVDWSLYVDRLVDFIVNKANRTASGALSHKNDDKTVWADGIHMISVPLSSIGLARQRIDLLTLNYEQIVLYRQALFNTTYQLWEHIRNDNATADNDPRIWATGNAWALSGIIRLKVAIIKSDHAAALRHLTGDLLEWAMEIINGMMSNLGTNGLVRNFIEMPSSDPQAFGDAASSSVLAWGIYRLAPIVPDRINATHLAAADDLRHRILDQVTSLGQLGSSVNVLEWGEIGLVSTEANAFALQMIAAHRDYEA